MKKNIKYMFSATLFFMTIQCANVLYLGSSGIGPQVLTSICFIIKTIIFFKGKMPRIKKDRSRLASIALAVLMVVIIASTLINEQFSEKWLVILQLAVYIVTFLFIKRAVKNIDNESLYGIVRTIIIFVIVIGIVQWLITMFVPPARILLKYIFYNDNSTDVYFNHNDYFHNRRIYSTFMEPSYMSAFVVGAFYYLISFWNRIKENYLILLLLIVILFASSSSTAYGNFLITGIVFILSVKEIKLSWKILIMAIAMFAAFFIYSLFYNVLDAVIFSKALTGSGITRARWNYEAYDAFLTSPLIGVGYKAIRGSSIIFSLLGQVGIFGLVTFVLFNLNSVWRVFFRNILKKNYDTGYYAVLYAVISSFISLVIACPDLDLCSYWFWLYLLASYNGHELVRFKNGKKKLIRSASNKYCNQ
nr:O-antigen ligase family protein [Butyrivibrio sp. WCE2006]